MPQSEEMTESLDEAIALLDIIQCTYGSDGFAADNQAIMCTLTVASRLVKTVADQLNRVDDEPPHKAR